MTDKLKEKIVSYAYGSAGFIDIIIARYNIITDVEAKKVYEEYKLTSVMVNNLTEEKCPTEVVEKVKKKIKNNNAAKVAVTKSTLLYGSKWLAGATAAIVITMTGIIYYQEKRQAEEIYTQQQVELAELQTKEALAIVGKVLKNSKNVLTNDVLVKQVSKPINLSMRTVNLLFRKGAKHETIN